MTTSTKFKIGFIASGNGAVLNHIVKLCERGVLDAQVTTLITDRGCDILKKATKWTACKSINLNCTKDTPSSEVSEKIATALEREELDLLCLSYNRLITEPILSKFPNKILNMHLSLLPAYKGFGGVSKSLSDGVRFGGATIHFVDKSIDAGPQIIQSIIPLRPNMQRKEYEQALFSNLCQDYAQAIDWIIQDRVSLKNQKVHVKMADYTGMPTNPAREKNYN